MQEIRIHGRGGQGSVVTAELLAIAAFRSGLYSQAFPYLGGGGERRGAPVQAFCRIGDAPIKLKCQIKEPDYVIVQDDSLLDLVDVFQGLKPQGVVLINSEKDLAGLGLNEARFKVYTFGATDVALRVLKKPITNTALLGAFAAVTGLLELKPLEKAVYDKFSEDIGKLNVSAMVEAFNMTINSGGGSNW